jgi:hypothetical protein
MVKNIANAGEFPLLRHAIYELIKAQGENGAIVNELECPVCFQRFNILEREPMIHSCGQSYCKECYHVMNSCPMCRGHIPINVRLSVNLRLRDIVEKTI